MSITIWQTILLTVEALNFFLHTSGFPECSITPLVVIGRAGCQSNALLCIPVIQCDPNLFWTHWLGIVHPFHRGKRFKDLDYCIHTHQNYRVNSPLLSGGKDVFIYKLVTIFNVLIRRLWCPELASVSRVFPNKWPPASARVMMAVKCNFKIWYNLANLLEAHHQKVIFPRWCCQSRLLHL